MKKLSRVGRRVRRPLTTVREVKVPGDVRVETVEVVKEKIVYQDREVIREVQVKDTRAEQFITNLEKAIQEEKQKTQAAEAKLAEAQYKEPETAPEQPEVSYDNPPEEIADLVDPNLTAQQNLEALIKKFRDAKSLEEMSRSNGDMNAAMEHLRDAQRYDSGIAWNRAVLAEVV